MKNSAYFNEFLLRKLLLLLLFAINSYGNGVAFVSPCRLLPKLISRWSPEILSRDYEAERKKEGERENDRERERANEGSAGSLPRVAAREQEEDTERNIFRFTHFLATHHFHLQPPLILLALVLVLLHFFLRLSHLLLEHVEESALHLRRHAGQ